MNKIEKLRKGELAAFKSGILIVLLSLVEAIVGLLSGSIILISDALHNVTDSLSLFASSFALKISRRKPTEKFPYGYYKAENLAAFLISLFILYAAWELIQEGYSRIFSVPKITMPIETLTISIISSFVSAFLARYMERVGKEIKSQALLTNAKERFTHVFSGLFIFIVILLSFFKVPYIEGIATILFSIIVFKAGITSAKDSIFSLMDVAPSREIKEKIEKIILSVNGVKELKKLKLRRSGSFILGEATIRIGKKIDVESAHKITEKIERTIKENVEDVESITIHVEPYEKEEVKIAIPIAESDGLNSKISKHFGRAKYFIFVYVNRKSNKLKDFYIKLNPYRKEIAKAGLSTSKFLVKERVDIVITEEIGEISFNTLKGNLVEIYKAKGKIVKEIIENFLKNQLKILKEPTRREEEKVFTKIQKMIWGRWGRRGRGGPWWRK
ncbi:MAG: cation diffusion facilitator family transporter [Candidatus Aenigmarchaeota archaeon]|nr:cation diffusion facilitator family transporter [Candidatus Aenigmarchaeota archaeon]